MCVIMPNLCGTFVIDLAAGLISGIVIFLVGLFWPIIPKSWRKHLLRKFWGNAVLTKDFVIAYGALKDSRHRVPGPDEFWYDKFIEGGTRWVGLRGPRTYVVSDCEMRSASYLVSSISPYRKSAIRVLSDHETFQGLDRTIVALGSHTSNEISRLIMEDRENKFFEFVQEDKEVFIRDKASGKEFRGFKLPHIRDYGVIIKIPNRRFKGENLFMCAGLGEWGTSGASWYLANEWRALNKEFNGGFGIVVEVELGSDESAIRLSP